jgi:hypothetical protein
VWGVNAYVELGRIYKDNELLAATVNNRPRVSDFAVFYNAAKLAHVNFYERKIDVYSPSEQEQSLRTITAPVVAEKPLLAIYPPYFFGMVMPLSAVPAGTAWMIWCTLGAISLLLTLYFITKSDQFKSPFVRYFAFLGVLCCYPAWLSFRLGQVSLFLPAAIAAFWYLLIARRYLLAGIVSGFCMLKVQYLPMLAVVGLIMGRAKYLGGLLIAMVALFGLSIYTLGWDNILSFPGAVHYNETSANAGGVSPEMMQNFRGMLTVILGGETPDIRMAALAIFVVLCVSITELWWRMRKHGLTEKKLLKGAAVTTLIMLIASPHTHTQDYLAAAPAAIWLWQATANDDRASSLYIRRTIAAFPALSWVFFLLQPVFLFLRIQPYFIWATALVVMTLTVLDDTTLTLESIQQRQAV